MSDFDWKATLKKLAPTAVTLLAGPWAGMAVKYLGDALNIDEPTQEKIAQAFQSQQLNGDQLVAVKNAEHALALKLEELGVERDKLDVENTKDARNMQIATRSLIPGALAFLITFGFFGILGWMLSDASIKPSEALLIMLGALATAWGSVVNYFFGSSQGSRDKTAMIDKLSK
jgi:hypothetical protein